MSDSVVDSLVLDLLEWMGAGPRPYGEVLDAWRTSCPRLPIWEEANDRGFVMRHLGNGTGPLVSVSQAGREHLREHRPGHVLGRASMSNMDDVDFQSVLGDLRAELDALDARLVLLLKERAAVVRQVIQRKKASGLGPVDLKREEEMLSQIAAQAAAVGLDPQIATRILRAIIDAFTELETDALGSGA